MSQEPKIPPEALAPSGRTPESLPGMAGDPDKAQTTSDPSDGALPDADDLPKVDNPIPPG